MAELRWRGALGGADVADVQALVAAATEVDGTAPLSEHVLLHVRHGGDAEAAHLLAREEGELVGFAHLDLTDPADATRWLQVLNDLRLALGTRLGISEDDDEPDLDDPEQQPRLLYHWLTAVQDTVVQHLMG